jgi:hypothetical protein
VPALEKSPTPGIAVAADNAGIFPIALSGMPASIDGVSRRADHLYHPSDIENGMSNLGRRHVRDRLRRVLHCACEAFRTVLGYACELLTCMQRAGDVVSRIETEPVSSSRVR